MLAYPMVTNALYLQYFNSMGEFQRIIIISSIIKNTFGLI
jgi:hypothetical protein